MDTNAAKISCLRACATVVPLAALLGGCVAESNNSNILGRKQDLAPSLEAVQLQGVADNNSRPDTAARSDQASLTGPGSRLNRGEWEPVPFVVPIDGIDGMPTYSRHTTFADDTARQRGEFPTPISSLELAGDSLVDRRDEMLFAPIDSFAQALLIGPLAIGGQRNVQHRVDIGAPAAGLQLSAGSAGRRGETAAIRGAAIAAST